MRNHEEMEVVVSALVRIEAMSTDENAVVEARRALAWVNPTDRDRIVDLTARLTEAERERDEARERAERLDVQLQDTQSDYGALEAARDELRDRLIESRQMNRELALAHAAAEAEIVRLTAILDQELRIDKGLDCEASRLKVFNAELEATVARLKAEQDEAWERGVRATVEYSIRSLLGKPCKEYVDEYVEEALRKVRAALAGEVPEPDAMGGE